MKKTKRSKGSKDSWCVGVGGVSVKENSSKVLLTECHLRKGWKDMRDDLVEECSTLIS